MTLNAELRRAHYNGHDAAARDDTAAAVIITTFLHAQVFVVMYNCVCGDVFLLCMLEVM